MRLARHCLVMITRVVLVFKGLLTGHANSGRDNTAMISNFRRGGAPIPPQTFPILTTLPTWRFRKRRSGILSPPAPWGTSDDMSAALATPSSLSSKDRLPPAGPFRVWRLDQLGSSHYLVG